MELGDGLKGRHRRTDGRLAGLHSLNREFKLLSKDGGLSWCWSLNVIPCPLSLGLVFYHNEGSLDGVALQNLRYFLIIRHSYRGDSYRQRSHIN